jgi:transcription elongation GreA/GreB family factor
VEPSVVAEAEAVVAEAAGAGAEAAAEEAAKEEGEAAEEAEAEAEAEAAAGCRWEEPCSEAVSFGAAEEPAEGSEARVGCRL